MSYVIYISEQCNTTAECGSSLLSCNTTAGICEPSKYES